MPDVVMPRLSDSMEEGTILKWLKADGDEIAKGDPIVEIETDKATMTYEADTAGVLRIVAQEGDTLPIGQPIAQIGKGDGQPAAAPQEPEAEAPPEAAEPEAEPEPEPSAAEREPAHAPAAADGGRAKASPLARRIARERGIDLAGLEGSGPGGRIVKADVEGAPAAAAAPAPEAAPTPEAPAAAPVPAAATTTPGERGTAKGDVEIQEPTRTQQLIARRMAESKATVPEFTLQADVDMEGCVAL